MNREDRERLHDYLDGRLSADERARFEQRLADDAELSATVEAYRRLGDELRGAPDELPAGFYARARERFARRRGTPRGLMAWVTWETVGLGAAALLLVAIFVPAMLRDDPALAPHLPDILPQETVDRVTSEEIALPERQQAAKVEEARGEDDDLNEVFAPSPPPPPPPPAASRRQRDVAESESLLREKESRADFKALEGPPPPPAVASAGDFAATTHSAELAVGLAPAGGFLVIDDPEEWSALLPGAEGLDEGMSMLSPDFRNERVVLIGPRTAPIDCTRIEVRVDGEIVLAVPAADDPARGSRGCAVVVPRSPPTVRVVDAP